MAQEIHSVALHEAWSAVRKPLVRNLHDWNPVDHQEALSIQTTCRIPMRGRREVERVSSEENHIEKNKSGTLHGALEVNSSRRLER